MKQTLLAVAIATVCMISTAHAEKHDPSSEFVTAFEQHLNSLDPMDPKQCFRRNITEYLAIYKGLYPPGPSPEEIRPLWHKIVAFDRACADNRMKKRMPFISLEVHKQWDKEWIPWMKRSGWDKKEGWLAYDK